MCGNAARGLMWRRNAANARYSIAGSTAPREPATFLQQLGSQRFCGAAGFCKSFQHHGDVRESRCVATTMRHACYANNAELQSPCATGSGGGRDDRRRFRRVRRAPRASLQRRDPSVLPLRHRRGGQIARRRVRSRHRGRPRRRGGDAPAHRPDLPRPWRHRRGIRPGPPRRRICLGARPDRRHQELHLGTADLGHADRPHAQRPAGLWHDVAAVHARALFRRRQARAPAHAGADARRAAADGMGDARRCAPAPARRSRRRR